MLRPPLRLVALGDSYTIGTSVIPAERWPDQLVERLASLTPEAPPLTLAANLAVNGATSADVVRDQLPRLPGLRPEFVTLLVGVNDVVQGVPLEGYERAVAAILEALLARLPRQRLLTISTSDYTVTPRGADYGDPIQQAAGIRAVNDLLAQASAAYSIAHVDIHDLSLQVRDDPSLVAGDGLHPSGEQYRRWVDRIGPAVQNLLVTDGGSPDA